MSKSGGVGFGALSSDGKPSSPSPQDEKKRVLF